jgi:hypothetical protein
MTRGPITASFFFYVIKIPQLQVFINSLRSIHHMRSIQSRFFVALACLAILGECFTPVLRVLPLNARSAVKVQNRPLRMVPTASISGGFSSLATSATNLLLAFDSEGSMVDRLYNGIPATGAVEVYDASLITLLIM